MEPVSECDFDDVIKLLGPADLERLFHALDLQSTDIEKAQENVSLNDVDLKARNVLLFWRKTKGKAATRERILEALKKCENRNAVQQLEATWNIEGMHK